MCKSIPKSARREQIRAGSSITEDQQEHAYSCHKNCFPMILVGFHEK